MATRGLTEATGHGPSGQAATVATVAMTASGVATGPVAAATPSSSSGATRVTVGAGVAAAIPSAAAYADGSWWVWDPDDDAACTDALLARHDVEAGVVVCHPRPGATWPVLLEDLLRAVGKHPQALAREHLRDDAERLLGVWLRAEQVRELVVLRAHLLDPALHARLATLASGAAVRLWLSWHHHDPPPGPDPAVSWADAASALAARPRRTARDVGVDEAFDAARHEARTWRPDGHRLGPTVSWSRHAWPGCDVGALLQRLTIDATSTDDLRERLRAGQEGFRAEGRRLTLPPLDESALALLGPRLPPEVVARLRSLMCPANAAALMLALATGADAPFLTHVRTGPPSPQVTLLAGAYRVPDRVDVLMRAAHLAQRAAPAHGHPLLGLPTDGLLVTPKRLAGRIRRTAALTGIEPPPGARPLYGINPASPFAAAIATRSTVTDVHPA